MLSPPDPRPSKATTATPTTDSARPTIPLTVGRSSPRTAPRRSPHTGAVAKIKPVLAALVRLTPKVNPLWAIATPKHPRAAMRIRSFRPGLLSGSSRRRIRRSRSPPPVNLNATITSCGTDSAAYLVAAKFSPQKTAAKINEISVNTAALLLASVMPRSLPARARRSPALRSLLTRSNSSNRPARVIPRPLAIFSPVLLPGESSLKKSPSRSAISSTDNTFALAASSRASLLGGLSARCPRQHGQFRTGRHPAMLGEDGVVATIARASGGEAGDVAKQAAADVLTGRFIHLEEVAELIVLLASDRAGNVTKADVVIDGGLITTL